MAWAGGSPCHVHHGVLQAHESPPMRRGLSGQRLPLAEAQLRGRGLQSHWAIAWNASGGGQEHDATGTRSERAAEIVPHPTKYVAPQNILPPPFGFAGFKILPFWLKKRSAAAVHADTLLGLPYHVFCPPKYVAPQQPAVP